MNAIIKQKIVNNPDDLYYYGMGQLEQIPETASAVLADGLYWCNLRLWIFSILLVLFIVFQILVLCQAISAHRNNTLDDEHYWVASILTYCLLAIIIVLVTNVIRNYLFLDMAQNSPQEYVLVYWKYYLPK